MDLSIIREDLKCDNYENPHEFYKDLKIMFNNAKNYTPNKRSRVSTQLFLIFDYSTQTRQGYLVLTFVENFYFVPFVSGTCNFSPVIFVFMCHHTYFNKVDSVNLNLTNDTATCISLVLIISFLAGFPQKTSC